MKKIQKIQDDEYNFPYHYISQYRPNFTQTVSWSWGINYISALEFIIEEIKKENFGSIADIGTGDGRLVKEFSLNFADKEILGIDYSEKAINVAKAMNPDLNFIKLDIIKEDIDQKFDVVTLVEVFEHIPLDKCEKFIFSLKNLLNNEGIIFITVPHKNKGLQNKHYQHFSLEVLKKYFNNYFTIEEVVFFEKRSLFSKLIKDILVNRVFILNSLWARNLLYKLYKKNCFFASDKNCGRIFLKLKKK
jgi:2-polyprenyl-3-methyl-5-hydroxy-6-metoxy-1,4-benzoquinol methylase